MLVAPDTILDIDVLIVAVPMKPTVSLWAKIPSPLVDESTASVAQALSAR